MLLAAAPTWFADNVTLIVVLMLLVVGALVVWVVQRAALRLVFLAVLAAVALFVYVNRVQIETCARTCECRIAGQDLTVPTCDPPV